MRASAARFPAARQRGAPTEEDRAAGRAFDAGQLRGLPMAQASAGEPVHRATGIRVIEGARVQEADASPR